MAEAPRAEPGARRFEPASRMRSRGRSRRRPPGALPPDPLASHRSGTERPALAVGRLPLAEVVREGRRKTTVRKTARPKGKS